MVTVDKFINPSVLLLVKFGEHNFTHTAGRSAPSVVNTFKGNKHTSNVNKKGPTWRNNMQTFIYCKSLYMFRASQHLSSGVLWRPKHVEWLCS